MFQHGRTLEEIGIHFYVSRQRIQQILKEFGLSSKDGGYAIQPKKSHYVYANTESRIRRIYGISREEQLAIRKEFGYVPFQIFHEQIRNSRIRNIKFLLTFGQWWNIWQSSGHWESRGRKSGQYVMSRFGDVGAYIVDNVRICTSGANHAEYHNRVGHKCSAPISD